MCRNGGVDNGNGGVDDGIYDVTTMTSEQQQQQVIYNLFDLLMEADAKWTAPNSSMVSKQEKQTEYNHKRDANFKKKLVVYKDQLDKTGSHNQAIGKAINGEDNASSGGFTKTHPFKPSHEQAEEQLKSLPDSWSYITDNQLVPA